MSLHFGNSLMLCINFKLLPWYYTENRMGIIGNAIPLCLPRKRKFSRITLLLCLGNIYSYLSFCQLYLVLDIKA